MLVFGYNGDMKGSIFIEKILFIFLLLLSSGVMFVLMTKNDTFSSENALLIILTFFWFLVEYKTMKKVFIKVFFMSKKLFHLYGKGKFNKA